MIVSRTSLHCDPFCLNDSSANLGTSTGMGPNGLFLKIKCAHSSVPFRPKPVLMPNSAIVDDEMD